MISVLLQVGVLLAVLAVVVLFFSRRSGWRLAAAAVALLVIGSLGLSADMELLVAVGLLAAAALIGFVRKVRTLAVVAVLVAVCVAGSWAVRVGGPTTPGVAPPVDPVDECRDVAFVGLRGSGEASDAQRGYGGVVGPVRDAVAGRVIERGLTFADMPVDYPALAVQGDAEWSLLKDLTVASLDGGSQFLQGAELGADLVVSKIELIHTLCGDRTRVVVVGYSQGAMAAHSALGRLSEGARGLVVGVDLVADPWRSPGTADQASASSPRGQGIARATLPSPPSLVLPVARSWCHEDDPVCAWDGSAAVGWTVLSGMEIHYVAYASPQWREKVVERLLGDLGA